MPMMHINIDTYIHIRDYINSTTLLLPAPSGVFSSKVSAAASACGAAVAQICEYIYILD